jgi:isoleucyl-tRNA synthetase
MPEQYKPTEIEPKIQEFWKVQKIYEKSVEKNKGNPFWYYLDGPPYTTGEIHIGHAWGKALRDAVLRYKRMQGFDVWDRPGFDMHGLPIEVKVEKKLGLKDKRDIVNKLGVKKFVEECEKFALANLWPMVEDFKRLGVWLNWTDPYMTIKNEYIEGAWWALARAHKNGYLYRGKKSMTWCSRCATALAKHELEYETKTDDSIFVKLPIKGKEKEYLIVWTTTPWTMPFNMAVMAHPEYMYVKAEIGDTGEKWILAESLASGVIGAVADKKYKILEKFKGQELEGTTYKQPFEDDLEFQREITKTEPKAHTVLMSERYVSLDAGSGLVHCAPGCGPEDYEVGRENGITPYNELDEHGFFSESMESLAGLHAINDNHRFIELLKEKGLLVESTKIDHEYAHCWRCKTPVLFRATNQWFLATEKLRDKMREKNKKVTWVPEWAGHKWFDSWLSGLQDWCISRQRFWGIPLPIWVCGCGEIKVVSSSVELTELTGGCPENLHRPWIDEVKIKCHKCGKEMHRTPDVLDVWLDSGVAPWATLGFPRKKELFDKLGFPDFILEAKDQIRGWFNSLMCMSMISFEEVPYKAVYMHGHISDAMGRKMSKSTGNTISPYEIIDTYGADTLRFYTIGAANPGVDLNYNHDDAKLKLKILTILWNLHNFVVDLAKDLDCNPTKLDKTVMHNLRDNEERYVFSVLNHNLKKATQKQDAYEVQDVPKLVEDIFLILSRDYLQMVRDKTSVGDEDERKLVLYTAYNVLETSLKMLAPIAPFVTDKIWQNFKAEFGLEEESIHLCSWPKYEESEIDLRLEDDMTLAKQVIQAALAARDKAKLGIRWPVKDIEVVIEKEEELQAVVKLKDIIKRQVNCKEVNAHFTFAQVKESLRPELAALGKAFGAEGPKIAEALKAANQDNLISTLRKDHRLKIDVNGKEYDLTKEHIDIERQVPEKFVLAEAPSAQIYLNTERDDKLEAEGYTREIMRRVQALRKKAGLKKADNIQLYIQTDKENCEILDKWADKIQERCGASVFKAVSTEPVKKHEHSSEEKVKDKTFTLFIDVVQE